MKWMIGLHTASLHCVLIYICHTLGLNQDAIGSAQSNNTPDGKARNPYWNKFRSRDYHRTQLNLAAVVISFVSNQNVYLLSVKHRITVLEKLPSLFEQFAAGSEVMHFTVISCNIPTPLLPDVGNGLSRMEPHELGRCVDR